MFLTNKHCRCEVGTGSLNERHFYRFNLIRDFGSIENCSKPKYYTNVL